MARRFVSEVHVAARFIAEIPRTSEKVEILGARRGRHPLGEGEGSLVWGLGMASCVRPALGPIKAATAALWPPG